MTKAMIDHEMMRRNEAMDVYRMGVLWLCICYWWGGLDWVD
jgi:hypothetical protein